MPKSFQLISKKGLCACGHLFDLAYDESAYECSRTWIKGLLAAEWASSSR